MIRPLSERALILAPRGRDAAVAAGMLGETGIKAIACSDLADMVAQLEDGAGFALVTEEALSGVDLRALNAWLEAQPEWSDLPFILLTSRGGGLERNPAAQRYLELLGNVTFLERPFHPTTLVSIARAALRGRRRQYEARSRLESLAENQEELTQANETLEARVAARTRAHEAALAQLHEAQKLEMLGQLTGGVAHDFNNLLTPVIGNLDLLRRRVDEDPRSNRLIDAALLAASRAATLVQRLLAFARRQDLQPRSVDIVPLLDGMRDLIVQSIGPTIALRMELPERLPPARVDPNQLELAILNLAINARDAMPTGGTLHISIQSRQAPAGGPLEPGAYLCMTIVDTGTGMDKATLAHAVEPFFSTKGLGRGTGLGLSMVHGLAAQLGGRLELKSAPGKGTIAEIWLPVAQEPAAAQESGHAGPIEAPRRASVLLVDDEEIVRAATAEMLADMGYDVAQAASGAEALAMIRGGTRVEILVTDYLMPGMNGVDLARHARALIPKLLVLVISGYSTIAEGEGAALPRLAKPFRQHDLAQRLADLLTEGAGTSGTIPFPIERTRRGK
ncbi:MAG TPA: ATP-binding protein [Allosphingosinicella sp.]|nr:ATP-binding protein [Allosphingosinicella sp.]